jgi:hypothetical protein
LEGYNCRFWFQFQIVKSELELGLIFGSKWEPIFGALELGFWFFKITDQNCDPSFLRTGSRVFERTI